MADARVVIVGLGQLGGVFARGFLKRRYSVEPVLRDRPAAAVAQRVPAPALVLIAVGEADLPAVLEGLPAVWRSRVGLIQNELLPADWRQRADNPTVMSVWFEKRPTFEARVLRASPVFGPRAELMASALAAMDLPADVLVDEAVLVRELVIKNVYILTKNVAGLEVGGTAEDLLQTHRSLAEAVATDALAVQQALLSEATAAQRAMAGGPALPDRAPPPPAWGPVWAGVQQGLEGGRTQKNQGRSAPARLQRALAHADRLGVDVPTLRRIARLAEVP